MRVYYKKNVTITCLILASLMIWASFWQWGRHVEKQKLITKLKNRLELPVNDFEAIYNKTKQLGISFSDFFWTRVKLEGSFDFDHEVILQNRRYGEVPGGYVLTPFKLKNSGDYILISRGFIPYSKLGKAERKNFHRPSGEISLIALLKETQKATFFLSPKDKEAGQNIAWVDTWLRVDLENIEKQLPYKLLPVFGEFMAHSEVELSQIVRSDASREKMLIMPSEAKVFSPETEPSLDRPTPSYDLVLPADIHYGYIFEWAFMALLTILIGLILQLRK